LNRRLAIDEARMVMLLRATAAMALNWEMISREGTTSTPAGKQWSGSASSGQRGYEAMHRNSIGRIEQSVLLQEEYAGQQDPASPRALALYTSLMT
jgi:hypothetical protein